MKVNAKWFFSTYILGALLIGITLLYMLNIENYSEKNFLIIFTFIIIGIISSKEIILEKYDYSINKIFWYFIFIFLFIAPLFQYLTSYTPDDYYIKEDLYLKSNYIILIWIYIYSLVKRIILKKSNNKLSYDDEDVKGKLLCFKKKYLLYLFIINIVAFTFMTMKIGIQNFFIREYNRLGTQTTFITDILNNGMRVIPIFSAIYAYYYSKYTGKKNIFLFLFLILTIILNFPTSTTRYWIGVVYLGIVVVVFKEHMKNRKFDILIIIALFVIFPLLQMFKWYDLSDLLTGNVEMKNMLTIFNSMDFDAYTMLQRTIEYVESEGYTLGNQIISSILFFIPRVIWSAKPYPTGQFIAMSQNSIFTNLSCPLIAEIFIDFGIVGVFVSSIMLAILVSKLDYIYFNKNEINGRRFIDYSYPFLLGFTFFMMRGSLQPVIVYMFTFYLPLIPVRKIFRKEKRDRNENINI